MEKFLRFKICSLLILTSILLSSCYKSIEIGDIEGVKISNKSNNVFVISVKVQIKNPNFYKVSLIDFSGEIGVNDYNLGKVKFTDEIIIKANSEDIIEIPLEIEIENIFTCGAVLLSTLGSKKVELDIKGNLTVKTFFKTFSMEIDEKKDVSTF